MYACCDACLHAHLNTHIHACTHAHTCECMHISTHMHVHTHAHTMDTITLLAQAFIKSMHIHNRLICGHAHTQSSPSHSLHPTYKGDCDGSSHNAVQFVMKYASHEITCLRELLNTPDGPCLSCIDIIFSSGQNSKELCHTCFTAQAQSHSQWLECASTVLQQYPVTSRRMDLENQRPCTAALDCAAVTLNESGIPSMLCHPPHESANQHRDLGRRHATGLEAGC